MTNRVGVSYRFYLFIYLFIYIFIVQLCSGITGGTVLNGELYIDRFQKLIYLHNIYGTFHEDF